MSRVLLISALFVAVALAGCVADEPTDPAPPGDPGDGPAGGPADPGPPSDPVVVPVTIDGVSPSGVWLCAAQPVLDGCEVYSPGDGNDVHDLPHDGTVVGLSLTFTYTPVTPEVKGLVMWLNEGGDGNWTRVVETSGPSGTTIAASGLNVTAAEALRLVAYTMPDADAGGAVWVEVLAQDYQVAGELLVVPVAAS